MITAVVVVLLGAIAVIANLAQIADYAERWIARLRPDANKKQLARRGHNVIPPVKSEHFLSGISRENWGVVDADVSMEIAKEIAKNSRSGALVIVQAPIGTGLESFYEQYKRYLSSLSVMFEEITVDELGRWPGNRRRKRWFEKNGVLLVEAAFEHDFQESVAGDGDLQSRLSDLLRRAYEAKRSIVIFTKASPNAIQYPPECNSHLAKIKWPVTSQATLSSLSKALTGTSDMVRFENECLAWLEEESLHSKPNRRAECQASAVRRYLAKWESDVRRCLAGSNNSGLIITFLMLVGCSSEQPPGSVRFAIRAHFKRDVAPHLIVNERGFDLVVRSHGLLRIALHCLLDEMRRALESPDKTASLSLLDALPLAAGDLPPWVSEATNRHIWSTLQTEAKYLLASALRQRIGSMDHNKEELLFLATNALRLDKYIDGGPIVSFANLALRWPVFDQKSYLNYDFSSAELINPTLPDSFGPVTAVLATSDAIIFGSFTGELRVWRMDGFASVISQQIDDHAISRIVYDPSRNRFYAVTYSGRIHAFDGTTYARDGAAFETRERLRDAAMDVARRGLLSVTESGVLLLFDLDRRQLKRIWSSDGVRLKAIAILPSGTICIGTDDGTVEVVDGSGAAIARVLLSERPIRALAIDESGGMLAAVTDAGELCLISTPSWSFVKISVSLEKLWSVAFVSEMGEVVVGGNTGECHWFDCRTLIRTRITAVHGSWVRTLSYHAGTKQLWSGGEDQRICATNVTNGELMRVANGAAARVFSVRRANQVGAYVVGGGDGRIHAISESFQHSIVWSAPGHTDQVSCVAVAASDLVVASGSDDRRIGAWHLDSGTLIGFYDCAQAWVASVGIEDGSGDILAGDDNGRLYWLNSRNLQLKGIYEISDRRLSSMWRIAPNEWIIGTDGGELIRISLSSVGVDVRHRRTPSSVPIFSVTKAQSGALVAGAGDGQVLVLSDELEMQKSYRVASDPIWCVSAHPKDNEVVYSSDAGELGIIDLSKGIAKAIYRQNRAIWSCCYALSGGGFVCGGEGAEVLLLNPDGSLGGREKLPLVFSGANLSKVKGLNARQRTLIGTAGGRLD